MAQSTSLEDLVRRVAWQVRLRRAEHHLLRGAFWGAVAAAVLLVGRGAVGTWAVPAAVGVFVLGAAGGFVWGLARRPDPRDAARLADRAFGLQDRVATALEWAVRPDRTPLVDALVADATTRVAELPPVAASAGSGRRWWRRR